MNPTERLAKWMKILAMAQESLDTVGQRFCRLGQAETAGIRAGWKEQVKTAQQFVVYYEEKIAALAS